MNTKKAAFLDRDGTIIEDVHYIKDVDKVALIPNAVAGLKKMQAKGYLIVVVSNQSGIARKLITPEELTAVHTRFIEQLRAEGIEIDHHAYCEHHPEDHCACRKPKPGLILREHEGQPIDLSASFVAGDRESDLYLADAIEAQGYLVRTGKGAAAAQRLTESGEAAKYTICQDLLEVAEKLP